MTKRIIEPKTVSQRLKQLREEKGLTQKQLAEQSGISLNSIKNYESPSGRRTPEPYNLHILAGFFDVYEKWIIGESPYKNVYQMYSAHDPKGAYLSDNHEQFKEYIKVIYDCDIDIIPEENINAFYIELEDSIKKTYAKYIRKDE